ncbi:hypothetical protein G4B88_003434 [Cannabis sativa]|uniref:RNase H type-1 domain-containing protein n=1 Tax=Cannabis sativa TaxID=3483 RepID=A0A7J6H4T7_CANSA|nr:hypothetical protein G4B88_003434 [Cannabis sativa]
MERTCTGCWNHEETTGHALWHCPKLKQFWKTTGFWHLFPTGLSKMTDLAEFLIYMKQNNSKEEMETFMGLSWLVWNQRNQRIFQNKKISYNNWTPWAIDFISNTIQRTSTKITTTKPSQNIRWIPPKPGTYMLNCDAAVSKNNQNFALAAVIRDHEGILIAAEVEHHTGLVSILLAEISAIKLGLKLIGGLI